MFPDYEYLSPEFDHGSADLTKAIIREMESEQDPTETEPLDPNACHYCYDDGTVRELDWVHGLDHILPGYWFCPMCGRKVREKEEAK